jgi:hypothetical protein
MKSLSLIALASILAIPFSASAESADKGYIEAVAAAPKYTESGGGWATPVVGLVRIGANLSDIIAIEAFAGTTVVSAKVGNAVFRFDSVFGAYVKAKTYIGSDLEIFGRVGGASASASVTGSGFVAVANGSGFSYGGGIQYNLTNTTYLTADYMSYYSATGVTVAGPAAGIGMKF